MFGQYTQAQVSHAYGNKKYNSAVKPLPEYDIIANRNLFNIPSHEKKIAPLPDTDNLPETKLKLRAVNNRNYLLGLDHWATAWLRYAF